MLKKLFKIKTLTLEEKINYIENTLMHLKFIHYNLYEYEHLKHSFINKENQTYENFPLYIKLKIGYRKLYLKYKNYNENSHFLNYSNGEYTLRIYKDNNKIKLNLSEFFQFSHNLKKEKIIENHIYKDYEISNEEEYVDYVYNEAMKLEMIVETKRKNF